MLPQLPQGYLGYLSVTSGLPQLPQVYLATVDTDRVDADIILHIILYIHANLGQVRH